MRSEAIVLAVLLGISGGLAHATSIFAISYSDEGKKPSESLDVLDALTGSLTSIGAVTDGSKPVSLESLAFSANLGLFGIAHGALYSINTGTAQASKVTSLGVELSAMVFGPNGALLGTSGNRLYRIDPTTGKASLIGSGSYDTPEALEFDSSGNLYATVEEEGNSSLYRIDPTTGAGTLVGKPGSLGFEGVEGLAFIGGTMYGFTDEGLEIAINLGTGSGTLVRNFGLGFESTAADPPGEAPEPGPLLLAGFGLAALWGWRLGCRSTVGVQE